MTHTATVKLAQLLPGETINARVTDRDGEIKALKASIAAHGLIQPLAVRRQGDSFQVIDGNRRFAALTSLHTEGKLPEDAAIPINIREDDDAAAREASLAANIVRLPLHPADQFEAFAKMRDAGRTIEQIGNAFSLPAKQVKQRLALGTVIPEVLEAFRANKIDLECVQAFTIASTERQAEVWQTLGKQRQLSAWTIKEAITEKSIASDSGLAKYVGTDAYKKAGGTISADLFDDEKHWNDPAIAIKLASDKVQVEIEKLTADGWLWASMAQDLGEDWRRWRRLYADTRFATPEDEARKAEIDKRLLEIDKINVGSVSAGEDEALSAEYQSLEKEQDEITYRMVSEFTPEQKKVAGIVIDFDAYSMFTYGIVRPADAKAAAAVDRTSADDSESEHQQEEPAGYNDSLTRDLRSALTVATQIALANDSNLAEAVLIVTMVRNFTKVNPQRWLSISTMGAYHVSSTAFFQQFSKVTGELAMPANFEEAVAHVAKLPAKQRGKLLAYVAAASVSMTEASSLIVKIADPRVEKIWRPDEAFLTRLSKAQIMEALEEAGCTEAAQKGASAKKGDLVQIAAKALAKTKWLPVALRAPTYAGPGTIQPTEAEEVPFVDEDDDEVSCPADDPDCIGSDGDCHDACESA